MSFKQALERLTDAVRNPPPGRRPGIAVVHSKDLDELLYHFERLDNEARQRHYEENQKK